MGIIIRCGEHRMQAKISLPDRQSSSTMTGLSRDGCARLESRRSDSEPQGSNMAKKTSQTPKRIPPSSQSAKQPAAAGAAKKPAAAAAAKKSAPATGSPMIDTNLAANAAAAMIANKSA